MTNDERIQLAIEFNKRFIASNYINKKEALAIIESKDLTVEDLNTLLYLYEAWKPNISYVLGDYVRLNGTLYKVIQTHISMEDWTPIETPSLYTIVQPRGIIEQWGFRDVTNNPFMKGEKVIFETLVYESLIDNNVWSPSDYPQGWSST